MLSEMLSIWIAVFCAEKMLLPSRIFGWQAGMWKRLFFDRFCFRFHTYRFRFHQQKTRKQPLTIFLTFVGL